MMDLKLYKDSPKEANLLYDDTMTLEDAGITGKPQHVTPPEVRRLCQTHSADGRDIFMTGGYYPLRLQAAQL